MYRLTVHPDFGPDYVKRLLGEMDITLSRNIRQIVDWLGHRKFAIALFVPAASNSGRAFMPSLRSWGFTWVNNLLRKSFVQDRLIVWALLPLQLDYLIKDLLKKPLIVITVSINRAGIL